MPDEECVVYPAERVRRPVPEIKAVAKAVEMIRVRLTYLLIVGTDIQCHISILQPLSCQQARITKYSLLHLV